MALRTILAHGVSRPPPQGILDTGDRQRPGHRRNAQCDDITGSLLTQALWEAAERGVRVRLLVGSFNLDPRSGRLNTEMGVVLQSPTLAGRLSQVFDGKILDNAYEVRLAAEGLQWVDRTPAGESIHTSEPGSTGWKRFQSGFFSLLPVEWML